ncbi:MAG TPA: hypothetical protein VJQ43_01490, partial [Thermoplasmata archaeon]|nr:hypothetical protein [Thermoplasmata archaeon]
GIAPYGLAYDSANSAVYVANGGSNSVSVLNATSLLPIGSPIPVGSDPWGVAVDPSRDRIYVTNLGSNNVTVINGSTNSVLIAGVAVGVAPQAALYDPTDQRVFVADSGSNELTELRASNATVVANISVGAGPVALAFDPAQNLILTANANGNSVSVVDPVRGDRLVPDVSVSPAPEGIAFVPNTTQIDVTSWFAGVVNVLADVPTIQSVRPTEAEQGVPWEVSVSVANGTTPYSYSYLGLPSGCTTANAATIQCLPLSPGPFRTVVTVTDAVGYSWSAAFRWTVAPPLTTSNLSASPNPVDVGTSTHLRASALGGVAPGSATYAYASLPPGCASANVTVLACAPEETGTFFVTVTVHDVAGGVAQGLVELVVLPDLSLAAAFASPSVLAVNSSTELVGLVSGGVGPNAFVWSGLPAGCSTANEPYLGCTPTEAGQFYVNLTVTDSESSTARAQITLTVFAATETPPPSLFLLAFWASPDVVTLGGSTTLGVVAGGGVPPYQYTYSNLPPGCRDASTPKLVCDPTGTGRYSTTVTVTDSVGSGVHGVFDIEVTATSLVSERAQTPQVPEWEWVAVGVGAFAAGAFVVLAGVRLGRRGKA